MKLRRLFFGLWFCCLVFGFSQVLAETCANGVCTDPAISSTAPVINWKDLANNSVWDTFAQAKVSAYTLAGCIEYASDDHLYVAPTNPTNGSSYGSVSCNRAHNTNNYVGNARYVVSCVAGNVTGGPGTYACSGPSYSCPANQGWTLSGTNCTRPACASGSSRQSDGSCLENCNVAVNDQVGTGYVYERPANGAKACVDGCEVYVSGRTYTEGAKKWGQAFSYGTPCLPSESSPADLVNDLDKSCMSKGMCGGTVNGQQVCTACDQTSQTTKEVKVETPASGPPVTTTTTTTEVCTQAGSCTTTTNTSSSAGPSSTTTTKSPGGTPGDGSGDDPTKKKSFCEENPTLAICQQTSYSASTCASAPACTGDAVQCAQALEVWKTRCEVLDALTPKNTDDSLISGADATSGSKTAYDEKMQQIKDAVTGATADASAASQSSWSAAMSSGWFDTITISGCTATDYQIGGHVYHFDPCPVAAKISEIGSYALWITLVIGGFVFVTGGRAAGLN